jgi:hypothetical protein
MNLINSIEICGFLRVLTMAINTQNYWVFEGCPSSGILKITEHNISETLFLSSGEGMRWETPTVLGP